jgi:hypothetical protein
VLQKSSYSRRTVIRWRWFHTTDKGTPAAFYPFFSAFRNGVSNEQGNGGGCMWTFSGDLAGATDFGRNAQYGWLLSSDYLAFGGGGATVNRINNFRRIIPNPCPAEGGNLG